MFQEGHKEESKGQKEGKEEEGEREEGKVKGEEEDGRRRGRRSAEAGLRVTTSPAGLGSLLVLIFMSLGLSFIISDGGEILPGTWSLLFTPPPPQLTSSLVSKSCFAYWQNCLQGYLPPSSPAAMTLSCPVIPDAPHNAF